MQKKVIDFVLEARDRRLYEAITDNGAGGLSSSIGELGVEGCEIWLDKVPLKYPGLQPWEILVSESQERMTLVVKEEAVNLRTPGNSLSNTGIKLSPTSQQAFSTIPQEWCSGQREEEKILKKSKYT
jgi:hypothetical protein